MYVHLEKEKTMDELLNEVVPQEDLERFERKYHHELELDGEVTTETKFEYPNKSIGLVSKSGINHNSTPRFLRDFVPYKDANMVRLSLALRLFKFFYSHIRI
nr:uncharacterized protein LOC108133841 isoform X3 [Drosophila bipectinata]